MGASTTWATARASTWSGRQDELVDAVAATGKPIVALLFSGRPLSVRNLAEKAAAILECWYLGQESGRAVADVVFGDVNPGGKLPITIPRSVGHMPAYYNHKPSARRGYLFDDHAAVRVRLRPELHDVRIREPAARPQSDRAPASRRACPSTSPTPATTAGDEVVQLYIRDLVSSVTRPVKELKGFARVSLEPGETRTVTLDITPDRLAFYDIDMVRRVNPASSRSWWAHRLATKIWSAPG